MFYLWQYNIIYIHCIFIKRSIWYCFKQIKSIWLHVSTYWWKIKTCFGNSRLLADLVVATTMFTTRSSGETTPPPSTQTCGLPKLLSTARQSMPRQLSMMITGWKETLSLYDMLELLSWREVEVISILSSSIKLFYEAVFPWCDWLVIDNKF